MGKPKRDAFKAPINSFQCLLEKAECPLDKACWESFREHLSELNLPGDDLGKSKPFTLAPRVFTTRAKLLRCVTTLSAILQDQGTLQVRADEFPTLSRLPLSTADGCFQIRLQGLPAVLQCQSGQPCRFYP